MVRFLGAVGGLGDTGGLGLGNIGSLGLGNTVDL